MAIRPAVIERVQIGAETTPGTQVSANRSILSFMLDIDPQIPSEVIRPEGHKYATGVINAKEWTEATLKGSLNYNDIIHLLSACVAVSSPSSPTGNGTWTVTITGTPSGGTFTLQFNGQTTSTIAYNANAATVQAALVALSTVGAGNVTVTGGPGPGTPYTVTFGGALNYTTLALNPAHAFTGGTSPTIAATSTAVSAARKWLFSPTQSDVDTIKTYTVEKGSSVGACRFTYGVVTDLDVSFTKRSVGIGGKMIGRAVADGITLSGSPTDIALVPVAVPEVGVWVGPTLLGMTRLATCLEAKFSIKGRHVPVMTIDDSQGSYTATAEDGADVSASITVIHDSAADAYMTTLRARAQNFMRIQAVGTSIETGWPYLFQITMPFRFRTPKRGNTDGLHVSTFECLANYDSTFGMAYQILCHNAVTAY